MSVPLRDDWSDFVRAKHPYHVQMCVTRHPFEPHSIDRRYCRTCPHRPQDDCHSAPDTVDETTP